MIKKIVKYGKILMALALIASLTLPSYATVGASDGSAFVTKAEFDAALSDFNARLTTFEAGINSKIDSQVSSYLDRNGIWNGKDQSLWSMFDNWTAKYSTYTNSGTTYYVKKPLTNDWACFANANAGGEHSSLQTRTRRVGSAMSNHVVNYYSNNGVDGTITTVAAQNIPSTFGAWTQNSIVNGCPDNGLSIRTWTSVGSLTYAGGFQILKDFGTINKSGLLFMSVQFAAEPFCKTSWTGISLDYEGSLWYGIIISTSPTVENVDNPKNVILNAGYHFYQAYPAQAKSASHYGCQQIYTGSNFVTKGDKLYLYNYNGYNGNWNSYTSTWSWSDVALWDAKTGSFVSGNWWIPKCTVY